MTDSKKEIKQKSGAKIPFEIPVEGSLGLLALGAVGIKEWRKVRDANKKANKKANKEVNKEVNKD
jgi:hypothetical protein